MGTLEGIPDYTGPGVYRIVNTENQMTYIGSSANVNQRLSYHAANLAANRHHCKGLQSDYNNGAVFNCGVVVKLHIAFQPEIHEREFQEVSRLQASGVRLYNVAHLRAQYVSQEVVTEKLADLYCREHFGMNLSQFLTGNEAELTMRYEILKTPELESEIRDKYSEIIPYINKRAFYRTRYGVDYDEFLEMTPEQQKEVKRNFGINRF